MGDSPLIARKLIFEPHGGFGRKDPDGNPWPLGYISIDTPQPIFELGVFLVYDRDELLALAAKIVSAVNAHDALANCRDILRELIDALPNAPLGKEEGPLLIRARAALAAA